MKVRKKYVLEALEWLIKNNPDSQLIAPLGHTDDMLERDFYKPAGKKLIMKIENNGRWFPCILL